MKVKGTSVELMVEHVEVSIAFYREILGFELMANEEEDGAPYWAKMRLQHFEISFKSADRLKKEVSFMQERSIGGTTMLCFQVENLEDFHLDITSQCAVLNHPHPTPCGATQFSMKDPDGYVLTFERFD